MTDDQLMMMARAAGFSMIPPQDSSDADFDTASVKLAAEAPATSTGYLTKLRAALPASPSVTTWFQSRAPA